jgi:hypothetical protein
MYRKSTPFYIASLMIILSTATPVNANRFLQTLSTLLDSFTTGSVCSNSVAPNAAQSKKYTLSRKQVEDYLDNYFASLGYELYPNITQDELTSMKSAVINTTQYATDSYIWVSGVRFYDKNKVDSCILDAIIQSIEQSSYTIAYNQSYNSALATKVSQSIRKSAASYIQKQSFLDPQQLKQYFGYSLTQLVRERINKIDMPYQQSYTQPVVYNTPKPTAPPLYESTSCCICMESFSSSCTRVYLKPCGHDICESCALNWFFPANKPDRTRTCPQCRSSVNFDALFNDLGL